MPGADLRPWHLRDMLAWFVVTAAGGAAMLAAWFGTSGTVLLRSQYAWLNVGVAGVIAVGVANCVWLVAGRHSVAAYRTRLQTLVGDALSSARIDGSMAGERRSAPLVAVHDGARYHRSDCQLVRGKYVVSETEDGHIAAGRQACGICQP